MVAKLARWLLIGIGMLAIVACTPVVAPETVATPEVEVVTTPSPQSEAAPTAPATLPAATVVPTPEAEEETMSPQPSHSEVAALAQEDLAERLSLAVEQIEVREVRAVTWPDGSLGCPQPGMMYTQALEEGLLIRLSAAGEMYFYHSGSNQQPFLCEQTSQITATGTPKADELIPPPDSEID